MFNETDSLGHSDKQGYEYIIGPVDTDSISFNKSDGSPFTEEEQRALLAELNSLSPEFMIWESDGYFEKCIAAKAKNYVLWDPHAKKESERLTIKGSALKATSKEKRLKRFIDDWIWTMVRIDNTEEMIREMRRIYDEVALEILNITDITDWCSKKTITDKVLNPARENEAKVLRAIEGTHVQEGDKVYVFFLPNKELCLREQFQGEYNVDKLLEKLYQTAKVFKFVVDLGHFPNYSLKRNKKELETLCV